MFVGSRTNLKCRHPGLAEAYSAAAEKLARTAFPAGQWKKIVPVSPLLYAARRTSSGAISGGAFLPAAHPRRTAAIPRTVQS
jgi:hypothetical protein